MVEFKSLEKKENIYLYAGDLSQTLINDIDNKFIGLSLSQSNSNHIQFDITDPIPLQNNTVDIFCAEDVMEHIEYKFQTNIFNEIHRILKPNGILRLLTPDLELFAKAYVNNDKKFFEMVKEEDESLRTDLGYGGMFMNSVVSPGQDTVLFDRSLNKFIGALLLFGYF